MTNCDKKSKLGTFVFFGVAFQLFTKYLHALYVLQMLEKAYTHTRSDSLTEYWNDVKHAKNDWLIRVKMKLIYGSNLLSGRIRDIQNRRKFYKNHCNTYFFLR